MPERHILVLGDAMADWLGYGLEDAYSEQPDMGVIRKHKTVSGLIRYQPKGDPADWAAAAKGILATEKPDAIVVMLGLNDRMPMREPVAEKAEGKSAADNKVDKKDNKKDAKAKPDGKPAEKPDDKPADAELSPGDAAGADLPPVIVPEKRARSPDGVYEYREERWVELYTRKIEEMIGVLVRGCRCCIGLPRSVALGDRRHAVWIAYRERGAGKAGITYVDVWDGFVDEAGRFRSKVLISKARSAGCALMTGCLLPRQAQACTLCRARSTGCWLRVLRRLRCRPNWPRPMPVRHRVSRRVRWPDR